MKGLKSAGPSKVSYPTGGLVANRGSPSLKENGGIIASSYLSSLKNAVKKNGIAKMGSPTNDNYQVRGKGSPDLNRPELSRTDNALRMISNKYLQGKLGNSETSEHERSATPNHIQKLSSQRRQTGKKLSFSPSPSQGSPGDRDTSINKSFNQQGSPKPGSPPKGFPSSVLNIVGRGSPKLGNSSGIEKFAAGDSNGPTGSLIYPGSPSTQTAEYLLDANKFPIKLFEHEGFPVTARCINHEDKRSKFHVIEDSRLRKVSESLNFRRGVCSKCAVRLANLGFKTEEICDDEEEDKKKLLRSFMERLEISREAHMRAFRILESKKSTLRRHYENEFTFLEEFEGNIDQVIAMMHQNKEQMRKLIEGESKMEHEKLGDIVEVMKGNMESLDFIKQDVTKGFEKAVMDMRLKDVNDIVRKYDSKVIEANRSTKSGATTRSLVLRIVRVAAEQIFEVGKAMNEFFKIEQEELVEEADVASDGEDSDNGIEGVPDHINSKSGQLASLEDNKSNITNLYVSFDNKEIMFESALAQDHPHTQSKSHHGSDEVAAKSAKPAGKTSTQSYMTILDKISESQSEKYNYYSNLTTKQKAMEEGRDGESLFVITPNEEDFASKQTPELGQKEEVPAFLRDQFEKMHAQMRDNPMVKVPKPTHVESVQEGASSHHKSRTESIQRSEMEELYGFLGVNTKESVDAKGTTAKCQKILFGEGK